MLWWDRIGDQDLLARKSQSFQRLLQVDFLDRLLALFAEREMSQQNGALEAKGIHVLARGSKDLSSSACHPMKSLPL
jgi:hypothetical protein